jgi:hypothetical protein
MTNKRLLGIYLNDHLAGQVGGRELARRCRSSNAGTPLAVFLDQFLDELVVDRGVVDEFMNLLGIPQSIFKQGAGWTVEKIARLKLNGRIVGYSDLSRVIELEGLCLGVEGKLSLWRTLERLQAVEPRLAGIDLAEPMARGERQLSALEGFRQEAGQRAFAT